MFIMKNKFKVFLSCLLALMLFSSAASLTAGAADYDTANATGFVFSDSGITVTEGSYTGYKVKGTALSVTDAGDFSALGTLNDAFFFIQAVGFDLCQLLFQILLKISVHFYFV